MQEFERRIGRSSLGNKAASGTEIIAELAEEHMRTGSPIVYTSADSVFQILADKALLQFTQTALGLSANMSNADIDTQASMITKKLNLADLQDPTKLNKLISQFSALYDVNNSDASQTWSRSCKGTRTRLASSRSTRLLFRSRHNPFICCAPLTFGVLF